MDLEEEDDRAAPPKPVLKPRYVNKPRDRNATAKTLPPVGAALEPFEDVAEKFDPAEADDGAAAPVCNKRREI